MGVERARPEVAVSYVDHNLPQTDFRNADDHRFLRTVAAKYGLYFSPPGNGISHQVHLERFSAPGTDHAGVRQPHAHGRGRRDAGLWGRGAGRGPGAGRAAFLSGHARDPGSAADGAVSALGVGQGCHPGVAASPDRQGGPGQDPGILRAGPAPSQCARTGGHHQHGGRAGGHHLHLPRGCPNPQVSEVAGAGAGFPAPHGPGSARATPPWRKWTWTRWTLSRPSPVPRTGWRR